MFCALESALRLRVWIRIRIQQNTLLSTNSLTDVDQQWHTFDVQVLFWTIMFKQIQHDKAKIPNMVKQLNEKTQLT